MSKITIHYTDYFSETMQRMREDGLLLVSGGMDVKPNVMTIGWGAIGSIWGRPTFLVLVRPSRYTYGRMEESSDFTVNVAPRELADAVAYCGKESGRDCDKFKDTKLSTVPGRQVVTPIIEECVVHYECRILHRNDVQSDALVQAILDDAYVQGDFHRIYFGEIVSSYADEDAAQRLSS